MKFYKLLIVTSLLIFAGSCGNKKELDSRLFSIEIKDSKHTFTPSETLQFTIKNKKEVVVDSVSYFFNGVQKEVSENILAVSFPLSEEKMGKHTIAATLFSEDKTYKIAEEITVVAAQPPTLYTYKILEVYPHQNNAFTQGLEFYNDTLYESTGQYTQSSLRKTNYKTGEVLDKKILDDQYFAEGLTVLNNKIYQLTWKENTGFIYDLNLQKTGTFVYNNSKEGWGLCNDGTKIYKSDGTEKIWTLNPATLAEESYIQVYTNSKKIDTINELEWVEGKIYANIWQKDAIAIVDPANGAVEGVINLKGLKEKVTQGDQVDVLNGIAYKGEKNILYITGKNWDKLFKIEIFKKE